MSNGHFLLQQIAFLYLHCVFKQDKASVSVFSLAREILNSIFSTNRSVKCRDHMNSLVWAKFVPKQSNTG